MKKLLAVVLTLALTMGMSTVAFADDAAAPDNNYGKLVKVYQKAEKGTLADSVAPRETFEFSFTPYKALDNEENEMTNATYPVIDVDNKVTMAFDGIGENVASFEIDIKGVAIGEYYYEVKETDNKTAGLTYNVGGKKIFLVVTVDREANDTDGTNLKYTPAFHYEDAAGDKVGEIINEYAAGSLEISKTISGNMADMTKKFPVTVVFTVPEGENATAATKVLLNGTVKNTIILGEDETTISGFELGHGDVLKFENLPEGVTYTVTEEPGEYTQTVEEPFNDVNKTINGGDEDKVTFNNDLSDEVDTGIALDSLPYILVLAAVGAGAVAMIARRKHEEQ